jgi:hypothetical protein
MGTHVVGRETYLHARPSSASSRTLNEIIEIGDIDSQIVSQAFPSHYVYVLILFPSRNITISKQT